jgi:hypothetical protein
MANKGTSSIDKTLKMSKKCKVCNFCDCIEIHDQDSCCGIVMF